MARYPCRSRRNESLESRCRMASPMTETLWKYPSTELRASASSVDLARNTFGAQSAFGYRLPSSPKTGARSDSGRTARIRSSYTCQR